MASPCPVGSIPGHCRGGLSLGTSLLPDIHQLPRRRGNNSHHKLSIHSGLNLNSRTTPCTSASCPRNGQPRTPTILRASASWGASIHGHVESEFRDADADMEMRSSSGASGARACRDRGAVEEHQDASTSRATTGAPHSDSVRVEEPGHLSEVAVQWGARATTVALLGKAVHITHGHSRLAVTSLGALELAQEKDGHFAVIARGNLQLPTALHGKACQVSVSEKGGQPLEVRWGRAAGSEAEAEALLRVMPAGPGVSGLPLGGDSCGWAESLEDGFVMEYSVRKDNGSWLDMMGDDAMAEVTIEIGTSGEWFGGGHFMRQHWPLNRANFEVGPYLPFDNGPNGLNTLTAAQWMTSKGLLLLADPDTPFLHVGLNAIRRDDENSGWIQRTWGTGVQNALKEYLPSTCQGGGDGLLRIQARSNYHCSRMQHPLRDWVPALFDTSVSGKGLARVAIRFAMSAHQNVREATMAALRTFQKPPNPPPVELVTAPIWTTWARYHAKVSQANVEQFAEEIVDRGLGRSVMEIDDKWQSKYGDFAFDPVKFPDPKGMVERLHAMGFKVTLWIMPFAEEASEAYKEGGPKGYFISSDAPATRALKPGFFHWWQPVPAAALDVTNPDAVTWFVERLQRLQRDYAIDGFKFDAGEPCFLPRQFRTFRPMTAPTDYTRLYVQEVASKFAFGEVRTGHRTTNVPMLTRMGDRFSTWSTANGLRSIIPTLLTSGLLGYPFCLPDMIGGNAYFGRKPDPELLVRWAQANALMPAMQFSIPPWDLNADAERLCRAALELRERIQEKIVALTEDACKALAPVCRPMWWLDPEDHETMAISDQYAIGDDLIVAPVVVKGQQHRDIYLPKGLWHELLTPSDVHRGPMWLRGYPAPLHKLPIFCRVKPAAQTGVDLEFVVDAVQQLQLNEQQLSPEV